MNNQTTRSKYRKGLEALNKQTMQLKNWLRGIQHKCSAQHLHAYRMNMFTNLINETGGNAFLMMLSKH
jgi:hypothetical protein